MIMNRKLRLLISVVAVLCIVSILLVGCPKKETKKHYSETFEGVVSTWSYTSANAAAEAFLNNEINSTTNKVTFRSYIKNAELSKKEIDSLNLQVDDTVQSVEKGFVAYSEDSAVAKASEEEEYNYVTVYIIEIKYNSEAPSEYKYYVPLPEVGERISKSYYKSVLYNDKCENCTAKITVNSVISTTESTTNTNMEITCRITEDTVYYGILTKVKDPFSYVDSSSSVALYILNYNNPDTMRGVLVQNTYQYQHLSNADLKALYGKDSLKDFYKEGLVELDFAYYQKTETGFAFKDKAVSDILNKALNITGISVSNLKVTSEYNITDGCIDNGNLAFSGEFFIGGQKANVTFESKFEFYDFGKTEVDVPESYKHPYGF